MVQVESQGDRAPRLGLDAFPLRPADPHVGPRHRRPRSRGVRGRPRRLWLPQGHLAEVGRVFAGMPLDVEGGDPARSGRNAQEHVLVSVELQRESVVGFVKLVAGVYAAIAIALLSFLMAPDQAPIFSGRMTVLVGALFATIVNMQVGNSVLSSPEAVSLVDEIHIIALVYVFAAAIMAVVSRRDYVSGREGRARRRDMVSLGVFGVSFLVINAILIALAAVA